MLFLMGYCARDVDAGEEHEDERLDDGREDGHGHEGERKNEGDDGGDDDDQQFLGENVAEEPERQRYRPGEMADDLDRTGGGGPGGGGGGEMLLGLEGAVRL